MVQIKILSGKKAGTEWSARRFPFKVGRAASNDVQLEDAGVWDKHFEIAPRRDEGFILTAKDQSLVAINGETKPETPLKNGDLIEIGSVKIRFGLAPAKQKSSAVREVLTWTALALVCGAQLALFYWLLQ